MTVGSMAVALLLAVEPGAGESSPPGTAKELGVEPAPERADLTLQSRIGWYGASRNEDGRTNLLVGSLRASASPHLDSIRLGLDAWVREEDLARPHAAVIVVRDAYAEVSLGGVDLRAGRQVIAWGRADRFNPTDNLCARDYRVLGPDEDDQRLGAWAGRATWYPTAGLSLVGIWLPVYEPHRFAIPAEPFEVSMERVRPAPWQWAAKVDWTGGSVDASLSYVDHLDLAPDVGPTASGIELRGHRTRVLGGDIATAVGEFSLRGEAAYSFTEDAKGQAPFIKNRFFYAVAGGDRSFADAWNVNLQGVVRAVSRWVSPDRETSPMLRELAWEEASVAGQADPVQAGVIARVSGRWINDTLLAELGMAGFLPRRDFALRPKVSYALSDRWKVVVGADLYRGPAVSMIGRLREISGGYGELRGNF